MHQINHHPLYKYVAWALTALLVVPYAATLGSARAQMIGEVTAAVVLPVVITKGLDQQELLVEKATAAVALALEDSGEFRVIPQADLERKLNELSLEPPLSPLEQVRLGNALQADKVITAILHQLVVNPNTGQCRAQLELASLDVVNEAVLNGAIVTSYTKRIPGWEGDDVRVLNEGLRQVAEEAVIQMLRSRVPRGNVDLVDEQGRVTLNRGRDQGIEPGMRMLVKRPEWRPDAEQVAMRQVGVIEVDRVLPSFSVAHTISGQSPRTGDKVYAMYTPPEIVRQREHARHTTRSLRLVFAGALLLGLWGIGGHPGPEASPKADVQLFQSRSGAEPYVRVNILRKAKKTFDLLFYRGESPGFVAEADSRNYLVGAVSGPVKFFEDTPERQVGLTFTDTFEFFDRDGSLTEGTVDITYNHLELTPGDTYYYKIRGVVDPLRVQIPIAQQVLEDVAFAVDPADALTDASAPAGPITYFQPAIQSLPVNSSTTVNPQDVTFEWQPSVGASDYRVFVYDNANLNEPAVYQGPIIAWTGQTVMRYRVTDYTFRGDQIYYWVVGNRVAGEPAPLVQVAGREKSGWILSSVRNFRTVSMPPPGPSAAGQDRPPRPDVPRGLWHHRQLRR